MKRARSVWTLTGKVLLWSAAFALVADLGFAQQPPYVKLANGNLIEGTAIRAKRDGTITIETAAGSRTFAKGQYAEAVAAPPGEIAQAGAKIQAKQYDAAVPLLEKVVKDYQYLGWDLQALKLLPQVYTMKGAYADAVTAYEKYFRASDETDSEAQFGYFEALLQTKAYDRLEPKLNEVIAKGPREDAARAQILRGDIRAAQNQLENAVLDYLRTAILFTAQKDSHPEALFKAASTLEKLKDPRAKDFYQRVVSDYPASSYAPKAKAKL